MDISSLKILVARLLGVACIALGINGLIVGFTDSIWKLGVLGWFTGGTLLGVVALILMMDERLAKLKWRILIPWSEHHLVLPHRDLHTIVQGHLKPVS